MKGVAASTVPVDEITAQPRGTVVYVELTPDAVVSHVQNLLAGRARTAGVKLRTRSKLLIDADNMTATRVIRVEVISDRSAGVL